MVFVDATSSIQTQINTKAGLASPALTGTPTAPTATAGTNTTQVATTAFVLANGSSYTLPQATTSVLGGVKPDGTTCTTTSGVLSCPGSGGISGLTAGVFPIATSPTAIGNSLFDYGVTTANTFTFGRQVAVNSTGPSQFALTYNGTPPTAGSSTTAVYAVNSSGQAVVSETAGSVSRVCTAANGVCASGGIANITVTITAATYAANTKSTVATATMTGLTTSSGVHWTPSADYSGVTGWGTTGGLTIFSWPSAANTVSYYVINQTGSSITTGSSTTWILDAK
jgi:hypothetical protein